MVDGVSATESGLLMLPMMGGVVLASTLSGQLISRTGRYKVYPVLGCALSTLGMWLLSRLETDTPALHVQRLDGRARAGIGMVLPVLVLAVQNSVPVRDLGAATSANNYFRQIGGSVGAAVFGTLFIPRLGDALAANCRATGAAAPRSRLDHPATVHALPGPLREAYVQAYADAMPRIFLYLVPVLVLGLIFTFFLKEKPLVSENAPVPEARNPGPASRRPATPLPPLHPGRRRRIRSTVASDAGLQQAASAGASVRGSVRHHDGSSVPRAALTLIDTGGKQMGRGARARTGGTP